MSAWDRFLRDLLEQWPLIWAGLGQTVILAAVISVTGLLAGIVKNTEGLKQIRSATGSSSSNANDKPAAKKEDDKPEAKSDDAPSAE